MSALPRIVILPGNGCDGDEQDLRASNFYGWAADAFTARGFPDVRLRCMPDPLEARSRFWLPFIEQELEADATTVLIGHSSGAVAALRVAERRRLRGLVLVAAYENPLGDAGEAASGYFDAAFDWAAVVANCGFVVQFAGERDRLVPLAEQLKVAAGLGDSARLVRLPRRDHFFEPPFPELLAEVQAGIERTG